MSMPSASEHNVSLMIIECGLAAIAFAASFAWPDIGDRCFARVERLFDRLAQRRRVAIISVGASAILLRLAILPLIPIPLPFVPDDFSFLLAADTFAHGHLTNPTPAMWIHFESIHICMQPTYMSMYFPALGLLLAAGKVLFGNPWFALLGADGLMCAALCWMLQAWVPSRWALLGGFIAVLRLGLFGVWINTYHTGGSLAALGGALVLGALPRLMKAPHTRYALLMAAGVVILVLDRPYEGMLLCLPVIVAVGHWIIFGKNRPSLLVLARRSIVPIALVIAAGGWMANYDYRAFGNPVTLPYTVNRNTYAIAPYYIWQSKRPLPVYRHEVMKRFYSVTEMDFFNQIRTPSGFLPYSFEKVEFAVLFYSSFTLLLPLIMLRRVLLDRRTRFLVVLLIVLAAGMVIEIFLLPHYVAPFTAVFYAIGLQAMRHLRVWKPEGKPVGQAMVRLIVVACLVMAGLRLWAEPLHLAPSQWPVSDWNCTWYGPDNFGSARAQVEARLKQLPGGQLAVVRYRPTHEPLDEWVYNDADIDGSKLIWAREMDTSDNVELLNYYHGRNVWLIEPDETPVRVSPYTVQQPIAASSH
jgi:hypothetical protein